MDSLKTKAGSSSATASSSSPSPSILNKLTSSQSSISEQHQQQQQQQHQQHHQHQQHQHQQHQQQSSSSSNSIPITVRFNAGEETLDDILQSFNNVTNANTITGVGGGGGGGGSSVGGGSNSNLSAIGSIGGGGDSLSTSPSQHLQGNNDELNTRNNFLQGNFFTRKSDLSVKQQLSPNHSFSPSDGASLNAIGMHNSSSPIPQCGGGGSGGGAGIIGSGAASPYNGSQIGIGPIGSGGLSPISPNAGISPNRYRRSISFPLKGNSPTPGYSLDINAAQNAAANLGSLAAMLNGGSNSAGANGGGDAPSFLNSHIGAAPFMGNGNLAGAMDLRSMDHCLNDIMRGMGAMGPSAGDNNGAAMLGGGGGGGGGAGADRMRHNHHKLSEHHLSEIDAVAIASNGCAAFLDGNMKLNSPSRSSPHSQGSSENTARYSRKVFVGGLPPDIDEDEITSSFRRFGPLVVDWPHKAESKSYFPPKGYAFLLFQDENSVQQLIDACITDDDKLYLCVSSPTIKDKPVQIRPWRLADADYVVDATMSLDPRKTVFVGGVPRPLKAFELAMIMDRLYGGVCYAGIDTDPELKYPKGAGRVAFSNQQSYIAAISARFVQLQHGDIDKRVEVKPYVLDDQMCDECEGQRCGGKFAPFFCANVTCLQYYCEHCWSVIHSRLGREYHKPLVKEGADRPRAVPFRWC